MLQLKVKKLSSLAKLPTKNHSTDAAIDLYSIDEETIRSGQTVKIRTGIAVEIPQGYYGQIFDRSSMGAKGIHVHGGVIDGSYRGEIIVCLQNTNLYTYEDDYKSFKFDDTPEFYDIKNGDKIAQMVILPVPELEVVEVEELSSSDRGEKGFGSSGR